KSGSSHPGVSQTSGNQSSLAHSPTAHEVLEGDDVSETAAIAAERGGMED
ncbi:unnamed protein product, partial [Linum tenue]